MAIQSSTIVDALDANLNEMFQDGLKSWDDEYTKIFSIEDSDKQSEKDSYESGFPIMPEKGEGVAATYSTILAGVTTGITVSGGATVFTYRTTNGATTPESPAGTANNSSIIRFP